MRTIINRLRRLENVAAPAERARTAAQAIMDARRRRLGADYKPTGLSPEIYAGCRTSAERINRARELLMARKAMETMHRGQGPRAE